MLLMLFSECLDNSKNKGSNYMLTGIIIDSTVG